MNFKCQKCGEMIEGDFNDIDFPELCEECEEEYEMGRVEDQNVDLYEYLKETK